MLFISIFTPRLCFSGEMQRYTTFIEFYTCLDNDFSTLIENGNNFQFSQAVCAKSPTNQRNRLHTKKGYGMIIFVPIKEISIIYRKDTNNATAGHF
jgi:hypothetical protein